MTEADYILFKLQQMRRVDQDLLDRLSQRFDALDVEANGLLQIGVEVPSAEQVGDMQKAVKGTGKTLIQAWAEMKPDLIRKYGYSLVKLDAQARFTLRTVVGGERPLKVSDLHDFSWTRTLWRQAAMDTFRIAMALVGCYLVVGYLSLSYLDDSITGPTFEGPTGWYFLSATLSTVCGDFYSVAEVLPTRRSDTLFVASCANHKGGSRRLRPREAVDSGLCRAPDPIRSRHHRPHDVV